MTELAVQFDPECSAYCQEVLVRRSDHGARVAFVSSSSKPLGQVEDLETTSDVNHVGQLVAQFCSSVVSDEESLIAIVLQFVLSPVERCDF